jgi:hypothetical protein
MQKLVINCTLAISLALILLIACSKDKFETKPTITIKSFNPNPLPVNGQLVIDLDYTDKEGDLATDSAVFVKKVRLNQRPVNGTVRDSFWMALPGDIPKKTKGVIRLNLDYQTALSASASSEPDSLIFRFAMRDAANNVSDTVESGLVIIEH